MTEWYCAVWPVNYVWRRCERRQRVLCRHKQWENTKDPPAGLLTTVAGTGGWGSGGDGGPALSASLAAPRGLALDPAGNLYIADTGNNEIRMVTPDGIITTVAGNGTQGFSGDGGPATSAQLNYPVAVAVDASGNLFIVDRQNNRIQLLNSTGVISTVAGSSQALAEMAASILRSFLHW